MTPRKPKSPQRSQVEGSTATAAVATIISEMGPLVGWHPSTALAASLALVLVAVAAWVQHTVEKRATGS